jgi:hypothetical protein
LIQTSFTSSTGGRDTIEREALDDLRGQPASPAVQRRFERESISDLLLMLDP